MGASSRAPAELSREELEEEVTRIGELEERVAALEALVGMLGDTSPEDAVLTDVALAGSPAGVMIEKNTERIKELQSAIEENGENAQLGGDRGQMLPIQRMWGDLKTGAGHSLGDTQKRAARLFGEFVERVVGGEATKVDASGQMYTLTSGAAEEVLLGKHDDDAENLLDGVKKASRSQVIARRCATSLVCRSSTPVSVKRLMTVSIPRSASVRVVRTCLVPRNSRSTQ